MLVTFGEVGPVFKRKMLDAGLRKDGGCPAPEKRQRKQTGPKSSSYKPFS